MANISNKLRILCTLYRCDYYASGRMIMLTVLIILGTAKVTGGTAYCAHSNGNRGCYTQ
jgi:hypothetical protein